MPAIHAASLLLLTALVLGPGEVRAGDGTHRDVVRDYLIVKHCGFETDEVRAGFRIQVIALIGDGKMSPSVARADRHAAAEEVRRHWRNRGMGHADPRCLTEGRTAVEHFLTVLDTPD